MVSRCRALCSDDSTCPNMIVEVVGMFIECADLTTLIQSLTDILPGEIICRKSWSRISAAVPGRLPTPASFSLFRYSSTLTSDLIAP